MMSHARKIRDILTAHLCTRDDVSIHIDDVRNVQRPATHIRLHTLIIRPTMHFRFIEFQRISFRRTSLARRNRSS